jgi:Formiminotransferase domain, N-terminal subdomain
MQTIYTRCCYCWHRSTTSSTTRRWIATTTKRTASTGGKLRSDVATLVACDIFVAAGADQESHGPILTNLLRRAQEQIRSQLLFSSETNDTATATSIDPWVDNLPVAALVHARCEPVYNRSSLHMAGSASIVAKVAKEVAVQAVVDLRNLYEQNPALKTQLGTLETHYPTVGLVDHVCTMPLLVSDDESHRAITPVTTSLSNSDTITTTVTPNFRDALSPAGQVARVVGEALRDELGMLVFFYGLAHRSQNRDYADVRGKQTRHLKRLAGLVPPGDTTSHRPEICSVGAYTQYIEHLAVRMNAVCGKKRARHLRRLVAEYDDTKLPFVHAMSLPYSDGRYEIVCLLQRPVVSNAAKVQSVIYNYVKTCKDDIAIEKSYRLRPTAVQSVEILRQVSRTESARQEHDEHLIRSLSSYFRQ